MAMLSTVQMLLLTAYLRGRKIWWCIGRYSSLWYRTWKSGFEPPLLKTRKVEQYNSTQPADMHPHQKKCFDCSRL